MKIITYLTEHWQGRHSLNRSFWINCVALILVLDPFVQYFLYLFEENYSMRVANRYELLSYIVLSIIYIWQLVGCWRCSCRISKDSEKFYAAIFVQLILVGSTFFIIPECMKYIELFRIEMMDDENYAYEIDVKDTWVNINGYLAYGLEEHLKTILNNNPQVKYVKLTSPGGRMGVSEKIGQLIKKNNLNTYVNSYCSSACTFAFAAGKERIIEQGAKLGFHSASFPGYSKDELIAMSLINGEYFKSIGATTEFIEMAFNTPANEIWVPSLSELLDNKIVTHVFNDGNLIITLSDLK